MRVIAGTYRGRRLAVPKGDAIRPTADRVREAVFSILGDRVQDAAVLDLFAGTGALGIEALSRGAASAVFVDRDVETVRMNLDGVGAGVAVRQDARAFARTARADQRQYDLVFLDPPYRDATRLAGELAADLAALLAPGGTVVCECDRRAPIDLPDLHLYDERRYGDTLIRLHEH